MVLVIFFISFFPFCLTHVLAILPELTKQHDECEKSLESLKKEDGALSRKQALMTIGKLLFCSFVHNADDKLKRKL